jgi:hypothetical protein
MNAVKHGKVKTKRLRSFTVENNKYYGEMDKYYDEHVHLRFENPQNSSVFWRVAIIVLGATIESFLIYGCLQWLLMK